MASIELRSVVKRYPGTTAVKETSLTIADGEFFILVGPSGCGKSTALNLVAAIDRPDRGSVRVCGLDVANATEDELVTLRRRRIGMVFQAFHLVPHLTVDENVALPLALDGRRDPERVRTLIDRVGLAHRAGHYPSELSGGEQQRTAVARALVHRPRVVVADEPTGNLDAATADAVFELLHERAATGRTIVMVTHDNELAARTGRTVHLVDGIIGDGMLPDEVAA